MQTSKVALVAACVLGLFAAPASAAPPSPPPPEVIFLDTFEAANDGAAGPVSTTQPLTPNLFYFVTVQGTFSVWFPVQWTAPCDSMFEAAPMFPSPSTANGPVGVDAETVFSAPQNTRPCTVNRPFHNVFFEINRGTGFTHVEPSGGPYSAPTSNHLYTYVIQGAGQVAQFAFRFRDDPTSDNYGQLKITVRQGTKDDCKNDGWKQFGVFKNQGDCVSFFATGGKNPPAGT